MKRAIFLISFFSMKLSGSKPLTSAAIWQEKLLASNCVILPTPPLPATMLFQISVLVLPTAQISPSPVTTTLLANYLPPFACLSMYSTASFTVRIFSASSSGISMSKASSKAMTSSTVSSESAPRSSTKEALAVTSPSSTPSCSTMICLTFSSAAAIGLRLLNFCLRGPDLLLYGPGVGLYIRHSVLDGCDFFRLLIGNFKIKGLFHCHNQFHAVQRVRAQIVHERSARRDFRLLHSKLVYNNLHYTFLN